MLRLSADGPRRKGLHLKVYFMRLGVFGVRLVDAEAEARALYCESPIERDDERHFMNAPRRDCHCSRRCPTVASPSTPEPLAL